MAGQLTGLPLIPATASASRAWWVGGWDRFLIPRAFARVQVAYGPPVRVPRDAGEQELAALRCALEEELNRLTAEVDALAGVG